MPFYVKSPFDGKYFRLLRATDRFKFPRELVFRASTNAQARELNPGMSFKGNMTCGEEKPNLWSQTGYWVSQ